MISKALLTAGGLGLAVGIWYGWFFLEERRKWGQPIRIGDTVPLDLDHYRRVL